MEKAIPRRGKRREEKNSSVPGMGKRIKRLRTSLNMSQSQLGEELQYSSMAISRWESGILEPTAEAYIKLGKLAGQDRWPFWERAGLTKTDVTNDMPPSKTAFSDVEIVHAGSSAKKDIAQKVRLVAIPLLKVHAGTHGEKGDRVLDLNQSPREEVLAAPIGWCPHPESTSCLRVKGKSMTPSIYDGDILVVDSSQTKHSELHDKIVVASHRTKGLSVSRFRHIDGIELLESDNRDYEAISFSKDRNWRIVGKVLWLIRQTP